jgi:hypothetical protein
MSTVNHPKHYSGTKVECIDAIESAISNKNGIEGFYVGQIIKYIWRFDQKNEIEDLEKARWYLNRLIKIKNKTSAKNAKEEK